MAYRSSSSVGYLQDLLQNIVAQSRVLVGRHLAGRGGDADHSLRLPDDREGLISLLNNLVSGRGEASGVAIAHEIIQRYNALGYEEKTAFLLALNNQFSADPEAIRHAFRAFDEKPTAQTLQALTDTVEPPRQEVIRRLNLAPGNTLGLVRMREDLLARLKSEPELMTLDSDFVHLFSSWFNRGFLMIRRIDWTTPAYILEKIIRYEAVHAIESWDDLRRRIEPADRRCFAFFHPALVDEPLIFVEVALTTSIPDAIAPILTSDRKILPGEAANTAVFYSISNCQKGLAKISFGHFLIKQVAVELKREMPNLSTFVTLSPVPGFRNWLEKEIASVTTSADERLSLEALSPPLSSGRQSSHSLTAEEFAADEKSLRRMLARYMLQAKDARGQPLDPVARFHLGNGAQLEQLNLNADLSGKGLTESWGAMVNYLYDLSQIEHNHERYAAHNQVVASQAVLRDLQT